MSEVTVRMTFHNVPDRGVNVFNESFANERDALAFLSGYIDAFPITITGLEVTL